MHPADPLYRPFPSFQRWNASPLATGLWERSTQLLENRRTGADPATFSALADQAARIASIDTGAVEGLYQVDRGFTVSVASMVSGWEAEIQREKGPDVAALVAAQRAAYGMALDAATTSAEISEAWIRRLHEVACGPQATYLVRTAVGPQRHALEKGTYKTAPNHVEFADGSTHAYAPVDDTPAEMHRLVTEMRSLEFQNAHPVLQASYVHYAFVCVHPFADGNGRVARVLASIYMFRSTSLPFVLFADQKSAYLATLKAADSSNFLPFVEFVLSCAVDLQLLVAEQLTLGGSPSIDSSLSKARTALSTPGGLTYAQVDLIAERLLHEVRSSLQLIRDGIQLPPGMEWQGSTGSVGDERVGDYRATSNRGSTGFTMTASVPTPVRSDEWLYVLVTTRPPTPFEFRVKRLGRDEFLDVRIADVHPVVREAFRQRLDAWLRGVVTRALADFPRTIRKAQANG